jgi:hypothetical protein
VLSVEPGGDLGMDRSGSQGGMPVVSLEWQKTLKYLTEALQQ